MPKQISGQKTDQSNKAWQAHIKAWGKSGLSGKEYYSFIHWKKKLRPRQLTTTFFVPVPTNVHHGDIGSGLKLEVGSRFKIEVPDGFTPRTLAQIIATLEGCR